MAGLNSEVDGGKAARWEGGAPLPRPLPAHRLRQDRIQCGGGGRTWDDAFASGNRCPSTAATFYPRNSRRSACPAFAIALLAASFFVPGCDRPATETPVVASPLTDGLTAEAILASTRDAYREAPFYSDRGLLYLSYRLHGRLIQEQQPWQIVFQRPGKLAADWFNARIRCDAKRLGCFVYDIETANLDNQWLSLPTGGEAPLDALLADPIAHQFVTGHSELPLATEGPATRAVLVPPAIGWLQGTARWDLLDQPGLTVRLDDATVDGRRCHHLRLSRDEMASDLWIDAESRLLRQMTLPVELLDPGVRQSSEVAELQFFARFHDCQWSSPASAPADGSLFAVTAPDAAVAVRHFVTLPEEFPCDLLGQPLPELGLKAIDDGARATGDPDHPVRVIVWLPGLMDAELIQGLLDCQRSAPSHRWQAVLNDEHLQSPGEPHVWHNDVAQALAALQPAWSGWIDGELDGMKAMKFHAAASAIVVDGAGTIQYAQDLISSGWKEKLLAATARVASGEDLASEMRSDYEAYLETYQRRREMVAIGNGAEATADRPSIRALAARKLWSSADVRQAGNMVASATGGVWVLDGWRSVVELGPDGSRLGRRELDLPPGAAIGRLRAVGLDDQPGWLAWAVLGQAAWLFDQDWKLVRTLSVGGDERDRILDVAATRSSEAEHEGLVIAAERNGLGRLDPASGDWKPVDANRWELAVVAGEEVLGLREGTALLISQGQGPRELSRGLQVTGIGVREQPPATPALQVSSPLSGQKPDGAGPSHDWLAVGLGSNQCWVVRELLTETGHSGREGQVGPQLFDSQIDPLAISAAGWIAVADSQGGVTVFDQAMVPHGRLECRGLEGLAWSATASRPILFVSTTDEVSAWEVESPAGPRKPE